MPTPKNAPLYQQIYDEIKDAIEKGVYAPKERIPSELELAEQYDVSRITVRRAVEELCSDGYLVKQQGRGTFVSTPHINRQFHASTLQTFTALCADNDMKAGAHVVDRQIVPARQNEMEFFGLQKDALLLSSRQMPVTFPAYIPYSKSFKLRLCKLLFLSAIKRTCSALRQRSRQSHLPYSRREILLHRCLLRQIAYITRCQIIAKLYLS